MTSMIMGQLEPEETQPTIADNTLEGPTEAAQNFQYPKEDFAAQKEIKNDFKNSATNWRTFLADSESHTKKNQPIISSQEGDTNFTSQVYSRPSDLDLHALFGVKRPIQEELSCKTTWTGILIHKGRFENWFHVKPRSHEGDIDFSKGDSLHLPYLEARNYGRFQERVLHQGELLDQQEDPKRILKCIHDRWIRWIQPHSFPNQDLPYLNPRAFKPFTLQRLLPNLIEDELKTFQVAQKVPKKLTYPAKLSRYKTNGSISS